MSEKFTLPELPPGVFGVLVGNKKKRTKIGLPRCPIRFKNPPWIGVDEALPATTETPIGYLCLIAHRDGQMRTDPVVIYFCSNWGDGAYAWNTEGAGEVTHWMPIPRWNPGFLK
jgi:hypothetical protein